MPPRAKLRCVVDTNVWVSALLSPPMMRLARTLAARHRLLFSVEQLREFKEVIERPRLARYMTGTHQRELVAGMAADGELVLVISSVRVCRDPDDDHLLALCKDGQADVLITGDKDLLVLGHFGSTRIIAPSHFLAEHT